MTDKSSTIKHQLPDIFSERLDKAMKAAKLNQDQLAGLLDISQGTVSGWLNGALPKSDLLAQLSTKLQQSADWLLGLGDAAMSEVKEDQRRIDDDESALLQELARRPKETRSQLIDHFIALTQLTPANVVDFKTRRGRPSSPRESDSVELSKKVSAVLPHREP